MHTIERLNITHEHRPDCLLVRVSGDAGLQGIETLQVELNRLMAARPALVVFDLAGLRIVGSLAIGMFVEFNRGMGRHGCTVRLAALQPLVRKAFEHALLDTVLDLRVSVESALAE